MNAIRLLAPAALALAGLSVVTAPALADPAAFYRGKTMRLVVGFSPGGGFDAYSRLVARHMGQYMPGKPRFVVSNLPGAGSLKAVQSLRIHPKDGLTMVSFNPGLVTESLLNPAKIKVRFTDVAFVGSITADIRVCYTWAKTGIKDWADFVRRPVINAGATATGSGSYIDGAILRNMFGARVRHVLGYPGSAEQRIAIERGELDMDCGSWGSIPANWIKDGKINVITRSSRAVAADMPKGVPHVLDLAETEDDRKVLRLILAVNEAFRPLIVNKGVPADRLGALRDAFWATVNDKAFLAEAQRSKRDVVGPMRGEDADAMIADLYKTPAELVKKAATVIK